MGETLEESAAGADAHSNNDDETIKMYEEMFKHCYTDEDEEFVKTRDNPLPDPPCVENWYQRPKRNYDFTRGGGGRGGGRGGGGGGRYHDNRRDYHGGRDNRDNRGYGGGHRDHGDGGRDRVHYAGRRDDRQQNRYQPYDDRRRDQGHSHRGRGGGHHGGGGGGGGGGQRW